MALPKRIDPVGNSSQQAVYRGAHLKVLHLKTFDARIEKRDPLPVQVYLASLEKPRTRERTITEDVSPHGARVVSSRYWPPGDVPRLTPLIGRSPNPAPFAHLFTPPNA